MILKILSEKLEESKQSEILGNGKINYEDDIVKVFENGDIIYQGSEDEEPMKDEDWIFNSKYNRYELYVMGNLYIKILI